jgi:hypothetical protein
MWRAQSDARFRTPDLNGRASSPEPAVEQAWNGLFWDAVVANQPTGDVSCTRCCRWSWKTRRRQRPFTRPAQLAAPVLVLAWQFMHTGSNK